jgi:hypothetical protein
MTSQLSAEARLNVDNSHKIGNPNSAYSAYSWQPPPVTKCGECPFLSTNGIQCTKVPHSYNRIFAQNKDSITPTCPMWQQQNEEVK